MRKNDNIRDKIFKLNSIYKEGKNSTSDRDLKLSVTFMQNIYKL
jgi:hypothetical protein